MHIFITVFYSLATSHLLEDERTEYKFLSLVTQNVRQYNLISVPPIAHDIKLTSTCRPIRNSEYIVGKL